MPDPHRGAAQHDDGEPDEVEPLRRPRDVARHDDPGDADGDVRRGQPPGAVRVEEHRVGDDAEQRGHRPEQQAPAPSATRTAPRARELVAPASRRGRVGRFRPRAGARSRTIATSAAMIPFASAGRSASSSSSSGLSIRSSIVGSSAVTDAGARLGHERRQLADRRAGPEDRQRLVAAVDAEPPRPRSRTGGPRPHPPRSRRRLASTSTSVARCASAASVRPGTSANSPTRWSATTRSIVDSVIALTVGRSRATSSTGCQRPQPRPGVHARPGSRPRRRPRSATMSLLRSARRMTPVVPTGDPGRQRGRRVAADRADDEPVGHRDVHERRRGVPPRRAPRRPDRRPAHLDERRLPVDPGRPRRHGHEPCGAAGRPPADSSPSMGTAAKNRSRSCASADCVSATISSAAASAGSRATTSAATSSANAGRSSGRSSWIRMLPGACLGAGRAARRPSRRRTTGSRPPGCRRRRRPCSPPPAASPPGC